MAHASPTPHAPAPGHLAALPGRPERPRHRPSSRPGAAHGPAFARPLSPRRPGPPVPLLRPLRGGNAQARRCARASGPRPAPPTPDLGGGLDPRGLAPPTPRGLGAGHPDAPALVPPRRPVARAVGATPLLRLATGPATARGL